MPESEWTSERWTPAHLQWLLEIPEDAAQRLAVVASSVRGKKVTLAHDCPKPQVVVAAACEMVGERPHPVAVLRITTINQACEAMKVAIPDVAEFNVNDSLRNVLPHPSTIVPVGTHIRNSMAVDPNMALALNCAISDGLFGKHPVAPEVYTLISTPFWQNARGLFQSAIEDMLLLNALVAIYQPDSSDKVAALVELAFAKGGAVILGCNYSSGNVFALTRGPKDVTRV